MYRKLWYKPPRKTNMVCRGMYSCRAVKLYMYGFGNNLGVFLGQYIVCVSGTECCHSLLL